MCVCVDVVILSHAEFLLCSLFSDSSGLRLKDVVKFNGNFISKIFNHYLKKRVAISVINWLTCWAIVYLSPTSMVA